MELYIVIEEGSEASVDVLIRGTAQMLHLMHLTSIRTTSGGCFLPSVMPAAPLVFQVKTGVQETDTQGQGA